MKAAKQTSLREQVTLDGIGVHTGSRTTVTLNPAEADAGIVVLRTDQDHPALQVHARNVQGADLSTIVGDLGRGGVATVEHVMATLAGLGIDNCTIEVDGPEVPVLDGSAAPFVEAIDAVGIVTLSAPRRAIEVLKSVVIETDKGVVELHPYDRGLALEVEIDFDNPLIGRQSASLELSPSSFRKNVARARTFGFMDDVAKLWAANRALGASLDNTVVLAEDRVLNPEGLRYADEFVRHKLLDAIGDLALVGAPLLGRFRSYRGGHRLNLALVRALLADRSAYRIVEPVVRRERGHADLGLATAAYLPDMN